MGTVIDISQWRSASAGARPPEVAQLERVLQRLDSLASEKLKGGGRLPSETETELLAILGALTVGSIDDALTRAERLADRLAAKTGASDLRRNS